MSPMNPEPTIKRLRCGDFLAEVSVDLCYEQGRDYSPTLSLKDAMKVERVAKALQKGDLVAAAGDARIYRLTPVHAA